MLPQSLDVAVGLQVTMGRGGALSPGAQSRPRLRAGSDRPEQVVKLLTARCAARIEHPHYVHPHLCSPAVVIAADALWRGCADGRR